MSSRGTKRDRDAKEARPEPVPLNEMKATTNSLVEPLGFVVKDVPSNGDCLYSSIAECLRARGRRATTRSVKNEILERIQSTALGQLEAARIVYQASGLYGLQQWVSQNVILNQITMSLEPMGGPTRYNNVQELAQRIFGYHDLKQNINGNPHRWGDTLEVMTAAHLYGKLIVIAWQTDGLRPFTTTHERFERIEKVPIVNEDGVIGMENVAHPLPNDDDWSGICLVLYGNHYMAIIPAPGGRRRPDHTALSTIRLCQPQALRF